MANKKPTPKNLKIKIARDEHSGRFYSLLYDADAPKYIPHSSVYIDREDVRGPITKDAIMSRAETLSKLTGAPIEVEHAWPCARVNKQSCRCPQCILEGHSA